MRVVAITPFMGGGVSVSPGQVIEASDDTAEDWIAAGIAVLPEDYSKGKAAADEAVEFVPLPADDDEQPAADHADKQRSDNTNGKKKGKK